MIDTRPSPDTQQTTAYRTGGRPTAEKQMTEKCQIARDKMTGFPCIRKGQEGSFVALLPVTKLQVEQWIASGGFRPDSPDKVGFLLERLETPYRRSADPKVYPSAVDRLNRIPVQKCTRDNWESLLATHLTIWSGNEINHESIGFPTDTSEWGQFLKWSHGSLPSGARRYDAADAFSKLSTKRLVDQTAGTGRSSRPAVECMLRTIQSCLTDVDRGLPFMDVGLYELLSNKDTMTRLTGEGGSLTRPYVGGECAIWPSLQPPTGNNWRVVFHNVLPIIAFRLWFNPEDVEDITTIHVPQVEEIGNVDDSTEEPSSITQCRERRPVRHRFAEPLCKHSLVTMGRRCHICSEKVEDNLFESPLSFWHWKQLVDADQADPTTVCMHGNAIPSGVMGASDIEAIHQDYLRVARRDPSRVRSICLSGATKSGKTTWLVSVTGMMSYPTDNPMLGVAFPVEWQFGSRPCSMQGFARGTDGPIEHNIHSQLERAWIDGDLPARTDEHKRALRCPVKFEKIRRRLFVRTKNDLVLVFNDIAGESIMDPNIMARLADKNQIFSHVGSSTDIVFLIPAESIKNAGAILEKFRSGLGGINHEGKAVDSKEINLILAISKIDLLKHADRQNEHNKPLLDILLSEPYIWPDSPADLGEYISTMKEVHFRLEHYFTHSMRRVVEAAREFRSVRYCGCSAFGFMPVMSSRERWSESFLPFKPQPVRAVDPLLWLLIENGLISPKKHLGISDWG